MCCAKADAARALDAAPVGVLGFIGKDGRPRACPVTPYVYAGQAVVSSTLAFTAKVAAIRRDPRVALLAGGCLVRGRATVDVDLTSKTFDEQVRRQELRKYPPSRQLLAIPGHRRLLWWYVGRASITIPLGDCTPAPGSDRITVTFLDGELPRSVPLDPATDVTGDQVPVPISHEGAACLLVHDEEPDMADLRQLTLHGVVRDGTFRAERRTGSLDRSHPSGLDQLRTLRALGRAARRNRPVFARWARETCA